MVLLYTVRNAQVAARHLPLMSFEYIYLYCMVWYEYGVIWYCTQSETRKLQQVCYHQADIRMCSHRLLKLDDHKSVASC